MGIDILQSCLKHRPPLPITTLALDVTLPGVTCKPPATASNRSATKLTPMTKAHYDAVRKKFAGRSTPERSNTVFMPVAAASGVAILPFTVDPFGGLGELAHSFLFGKHIRTMDPPPPLPPLHLKEHAQQAYTQYTALPTGLVTTASYHWKTARQPSTDPASCPFTPLSWTRHCLALNLVTALADHAHRSLTLVRRSARVQTKAKHKSKVLGPSFFSAVPYTILDPCPGFLRVENSPSMEN